MAKTEIYSGPICAKCNTEITQIDVSYTVPMTVRVDLKSGEVVRVIVWDEDFRPEVPYDFEQRCACPSYWPIPEESIQAKQAQKIAVDCQEYPGWSFGS